MKTDKLKGLLLVLLLGSVVPAFAMSADGTDENAAAADEVWGDAENEEGSSWTWFGMGYEMRNRRAQDSGPSSDGGTQGDDKSGGGK